MNQFQQGIFDKIQKSANINPNEVYQIAETLKSANFSDEHTVRNLVRQLAAMANKPISSEKEDRIVQALANNEVSNEFESLKKLFNN